MPTLPTGASYDTSGTISDSSFITGHSVSGRTLTFSTTGQNANTSATITVPVTGAANYSDYDVVVTITAKSATASEMATADFDALTFDDIKNQNTAAGNITGDLALITTGKVYQSTITWASSNAAVITTGGAVTRPSDSAGDKSVTLTATITNGGASKTKTFALTVKKLPAVTGGVEGTVTDDGGSAVANITVSVISGGTNGTLIGTTLTDSGGKYNFTGLPFGVYSLVAASGEVTVTKLITINSPNIVLNIQMPTGNQNTKVEVKDNTPSVAAANLDEMFTDADIIAAEIPGASVEIKLIVQVVATPKNSGDADKVDENLGDKQLGFYLDAELLKTVSNNNSGSGTPNGTSNIQPQKPLKIVIDVPAELQNMAPYSIIRVHGSDVKIIPTVYDDMLHTLTFEADLFSTYALAYTAQSPTNPPSSSSGGGSSGGSYGVVTTTVVSTYWIELAEAKAMAKTAKEKELDYVRSRRATITGIRKNALTALDGLLYRHDTVEGNVVQVRVYVDDPTKAVRDILVSGYAKGDTIDKVKIRFEKWFTNKLAVVSFDQHGDFGIIVQIAAKVDLSGMDTNNLHFYGYDRKANKYSRINTEYKIDGNGYLHFATILAGDIIVSDGFLAKKTEEQIVADGDKYYYSAHPTLENLNIDDGDSMPIVSKPPTQATPQNPSIGVDSPSYMNAADTPLKLEKADNQSGGGALVINLDAPLTQDPLNETLKRDKVSVYAVVGITLALLLVAMMLWAVIPRKDDPLVSVEEYRKRR